MESTHEFLARLRRLDVTLWADGGTLRYSAPKETLTPALLTQLREHKAAILAFLQEENTTTKCKLPPLLPVMRDREIPLSFSQQRLWFLEQFAPGSSTYTIVAVYCVTGPLNVPALSQSLNALVQRHEILRTTFPVVDGQPVQVISPERAVTLSCINLQELPPNQREAEVQRQVTVEAQCAFDLSHGPLFCAKLLRVNEQEHVLLLNMHHIISDGWSFGVSLRELAALYAAFVSNKPSPLPELPIQYADFAVWQRDWLQGNVLTSQLKYWKQQLRGTLPVLQLPTDRARLPVQTYRGAYHSLELPQNLVEALKSLSQRAGVTLFMTLLAAFQTLLSRYTSQEDIIVGSPIAGRNQVETEGLIGFFVNTLVLRTDLTGNPSFRGLLNRVREVALGAYAHQDLPFEKLLEELQPERDQSRTPLFQVMFVLQKASRQALQLPGLTLTSLEVYSGTAKFDLTLELQETSGGIRGRFEYNTDLFNSTTIVRMADHFRTVLEGVVANPEQRLSHVPLLTGAERHQLLVEWNDIQAEYPQDQCIHKLFEAQAARTPDAVAVVFEEQKLTYWELNVRANQLAHQLRALGVGPEVLVGLCVERSVEMVVGLLGILKAGGAYVPLDPTYPTERLAFLLEDTRASVLITQSWLVPQLPKGESKLIFLDAYQEMLDKQSKENPISWTTTKNLCYVIYTSGSTGKPKGILTQHYSVVNFWHGLLQKIELHDCSYQIRATLNAPLVFDASTKQLVLLLSGYTIHILSEEIRRDGCALLFYLQRNKINILDCTPSLIRILIENDLLSQCDVPERILLGGEALDESLWKLLSQETRISFYNHYGPTECTVNTTIGKIGKGTTGPIIGCPMVNVQVYILDAHLQPVPVGVPGEVYIGGSGLARGYLNRPELTAEKFIPNPFSNVPGARLYKTGDLARHFPDGTIEFLGRLDHQVKVRGFRIELGEIEAVLGQHPGVRESAVVVSEEVPGDKRLTAYVVPSNKLASSIDGLHLFLQEKLPDYMIPSAFVILENLPLTPSGKVDRRALPAPGKTRPDLAQAFVAPRTLVEYVLADIWRDVLDIEHIGINDNFFDLGGHSLLITRVIAQIERFLQVDLPVRSLFESPTIAQLAARIDADQNEGFHRKTETGNPSYWVKLQSGQSQTSLFCFPYIGGFRNDLFRFAKLARLVGPAYAFYGLQARGTDGVSQPHRQIKEMVTEYIKEMQTLQPQGPYFLLGECFSGAVAYATAQQLRAQGEHVAFLALLEVKGSQQSLAMYFWHRLTARLRYRIDCISELHLWRRIAFHLGEVKRLHPAQWFSYGFETTGKALRVLLYTLRGYTYVPAPAVVANGGNTERQKSKYLARAEKVYWLAVDRYRRQPYAGRITVFANEEWYSTDPTLGWNDLAAGGMEVHKIPGNHNTYITEYIQVVAKELRECLDRQGRGWIDEMKSGVN